MAFIKLRKLSDIPRYPFNALLSYIRLVEINLTFTFVFIWMSYSIKKRLSHFWWRFPYLIDVTNSRICKLLKNQAFFLSYQLNKTSCLVLFSNMACLSSFFDSVHQLCMICTACVLRLFGVFGGIILWTWSLKSQKRQMPSQGNSLAAIVF